MAVTHTAADATAATTMTNAVADIEQETPEIEKERQLAGVGAGAGTVANGKKKPHDHALASILGPAFVAAVAYVDPGNVAANITSGAGARQRHERAHPVSVRKTRHRDQQIPAGTAG